MGKQITRTMTTTQIFASAVSMKNGAVETTELPPIKHPENIDEDGALKLVQKQYGKKHQYVVTALLKTEKTYGVPLDVFMANAKEIVPAAKEEAAVTNA